jgi:hypothetical protein
MISAEPWVSRRHPGPRAKPIVLTPQQREAVEAAIRPAKAEKRVVLRGEALLLMAAGVSQHDVARALGVHPRTAEKWRQRFLHADDPVKKLVDAPRSGRPPSLSRMPMRRASKPRLAGRRKTSASR